MRQQGVGERGSRRSRSRRSCQGGESCRSGGTRFRCQAVGGHRSVSTAVAGGAQRLAFGVVLNPKTTTAQTRLLLLIRDDNPLRHECAARSR